MNKYNKKKIDFLESWRTNAIPFLKMIMIYVFIIIGTEAVFRKSLVGTLTWVAQSPFLFLLNLAMLVMVSSLLLIITKRIVWVTIFVGTVAVSYTHLTLPTKRIV